MLEGLGPVWPEVAAARDRCESQRLLSNTSISLQFQPEAAPGRRPRFGFIPKDKYNLDLLRGLPTNKFIALFHLFSGPCCPASIMPSYYTFRQRKSLKSHALEADSVVPGRQVQRRADVIKQLGLARPINDLLGPGSDEHVGSTRRDAVITPVDCKNPTSRPDGPRPFS